MIVAEEIQMCEGELMKLNPYHNDKESMRYIILLIIKLMYVCTGLLDDQAAQLIPLKQKQGRNITLTYNQ